MFFYLSAIAVFLCTVHVYFKYINRNNVLIRKIHGPKDVFLAGTAFVVLCSPVEMFKKLRQLNATYKDMWRYFTFNLRAVNMYNPDAIETIISTTKHNEKSFLYNIIKPWLKEGLLVSRGSKWQQRRKILTPAFHFNILKRFCVTFEEHSERLVQILSKNVGEPTDISTLISEYTLSALCDTAMGTQLHKQEASGSVYKKAIYKLGELFVDRAGKIFLLNDTLYNLTGLSRAINKELKEVTTFTETVIKERIKFIDENGVQIPNEDDEDEVYVSSKKKRVAMLDLLISAKNEGVIDIHGIQEEVDTFMFEGHDTTAVGLTFAFMLLANHKEIQDKIVEEVNGVLGSKRFATIDDLNSLRYLDRCIKESLRLYPPVPFIGRVNSEPVQLCGYTVPEKTMCHVHIFDLHRRADLFPDPLVFDPDRFLPENSKRHNYAYIPFSAGPRNCIGQRFAVLEMKSCIAAVLRNYELHPVTKPDDLELICDLVLRTTKPVYVKFEKRN